MTHHTEITAAVRTFLNTKAAEFDIVVKNHSGTPDRYGFDYDEEEYTSECTGETRTRRRTKKYPRFTARTIAYEMTSSYKDDAPLPSAVSRAQIRGALERLVKSGEIERIEARGGNNSVHYGAMTATEAEYGRRHQEERAANDDLRARLEAVLGSKVIGYGSRFELDAEQVKRVLVHALG